jgi:hypothetical protein
VLPAAWVVVLAWVSPGPADGRHDWPFNSIMTSLVIVWTSYALLGLLAAVMSAATSKARSRSQS